MWNTDSVICFHQNEYISSFQTWAPDNVCTPGSALSPRFERSRRFSAQMRSHPHRPVRVQLIGGAVCRRLDRMCGFCCRDHMFLFTAHRHRHRLLSPKALKCLLVMSTFKLTSLSASSTHLASRFHPELMTVFQFLLRFVSETSWTLPTCLQWILRIFSRCVLPCSYSEILQTWGLAGGTPHNVHVKWLGHLCSQIPPPIMSLSGVQNTSESSHSISVNI